MAVRYGRGPWPGLQQELLFGETLFPACSPEFARRHRLASSEDLYDLPLIWVPSRPWSWWFEAARLPPPHAGGLTVDDSLLAMSAAAEGLGVVLARSSLVGPELASGRLVRPLAGEIESPAAFHVVWRADSRKLSRILAVRDWLFAEVRAGETAAEEARA
jgi:LysR family glycine cleavage system transcriptional activator